MYTLNCSATDPMFGLPGSMASLDRTMPVAGNNLAGFSTTGLPGFGPPEPGTFATYRRISAHPTVALVMKIVTAPIVANTWDGPANPASPMPGFRLPGKRSSRCAARS